MRTYAEIQELRRYLQDIFFNGYVHPRESQLLDAKVLWALQTEVPLEEWKKQAELLEKKRQEDFALRAKARENCEHDWYMERSPGFFHDYLKQGHCKKCGISPPTV